MSVPAWKKAILERRKKAEDEEKKKQAEEEAYLATLPPWKRALVRKRERERQQLEREKEGAGETDACERSNSFQKRQQQLGQQERQATTSGTQQQQGWGSRRVTPPSSPAADSEPTSPTHDHSHHFFTASGTQHQPPREWGGRRRASVTTLPGADEPIVAKVEAIAPAPQKTSGSHRPRASLESVAATTKTGGKKVVSSVKKLNELKTQSQRPQTGEMPAWKKALLQRRKEKERVAGGVSKPSEDSSSPDALSLTRKESPQDGGRIKGDGHADSASTLALKREPSPEDGVITAVPEPVAFQRKPSPVEEVDRPGEKRGGKPTATQLSSERRADPKKSEPKLSGFARKNSPTDTVAGAKTQRSPVTASRASEAPPLRKSPAAPTAGESRGRDSKPAPSRVAPVAPTSGTKSGAQPKPPSSKQQPYSSRISARPAPEVVNRSSATESAPHQSQVIRTEGVTHRAPVYKEVAEWANVSEEDDRFRDLPTWKQALIRRRRADIAKRMGHTTSVDDVPLANGPVPSSDRQESTRGVPSEDRTASIPPWKKQMMQSPQTSMSAHEKKQLSTTREPPTTSTSNVRALLGQFSDRSSPSPPSPTSPKAPQSQFPRSPSPSSHPPPQTTASSSRPAQSSVGVPPVTTSSAHTTRRSFTWTPGEDTMPGDALSDDSSEGEEEDGEEGEYTVTNLDDTSEEEEGEGEEEEEEEEEGGEDSGVVLLRPPQAVAASPTASGGEEGTQRVRKTSSILVTSSRLRRKPLRRVAFSETDLTVEHYYPKYDYSDYEEVQTGAVSTGFSFSFWKSQVEVEATDGSDDHNGLSQRLHPSLRSPESDPDNYRYSPSRDSAQPGHTPPKSSSAAPGIKTTTVTLRNYTPSILSSYGENRGGGGDSLQQSYSNAMENGMREEEEGEGEGEEGGVADGGSGHLMPGDGLPTFYASLSSDAAAMLW